MSVYIPGMEMPTKENETIIRIQPDGTVLDQYGHHLAITAIHVPEHGRLIDADAMLEKHYDGDAHGNIIMKAAILTPEFVKTLPTVIPADPVKEGEGVL